MVVNYVAEVVGGVAVSLHKDLILKLLVVHGDVTEYLIVVAGYTLGRHLLTDNEGHTCREVGLNLLLGEITAVSVITAGSICLVKSLKTLLGAEAVVCVTHLNELLRILHIDFLTLGLNVGAVVTTNVGTLVPKKAGHIEGGLDYVGCSLNESLLVGILDSKNELTVVVLTDKIRIKRGPEITDVHVTCGAGRKSCYCHFITPFE